MTLNKGWYTKRYGVMKGNNMEKETCGNCDWYAEGSCSIYDERQNTTAWGCSRWKAMTDSVVKGEPLEKKLHIVSSPADKGVDYCVSELEPGDLIHAPCSNNLFMKAKTGELINLTTMMVCTNITGVSGHRVSGVLTIQK